MKLSLTAALAASMLVAFPANAEKREMNIIGKIVKYREGTPNIRPAGVDVGDEFSIKLTYDTSTFSNLAYGQSPYPHPSHTTATVVRADFLNPVLKIGDFTWNIGNTNTTGTDVLVFQNMVDGKQFIDINVGARGTHTGSRGGFDYTHIRLNASFGQLFNNSSNVFSSLTPTTTLSASYFSFVHGVWDVRGDTTSMTWVDVPPVNNPGVSPVPEPATWAMMIAGFGLVGGAVRCRSRHVAVA